MKIEMQMRIMQEVEENMSKLRNGINQSSAQHIQEIKKLVN